MIDFHENAADSPIAPAQRCFAISPHDIALLPLVTKAIYIGEEGDVTLRAKESDQDVTFRNLAAGSMLDVRAVAIRATGTTASAIVGLA